LDHSGKEQPEHETLHQMTIKEELLRKFTRAVVLFMVFCLASSWTFFALDIGQTEPVPWEKLAKFIQDILGWIKKGDLEGIKVEVPAKSEVWQRYVSKTGNRSLEIHIMDSAKSTINLMPLKMMMNNSKTDQGYTEKITIAGFPAAKIYDYAQKKAGLIVLILDRFVFQIFGENFEEAKVSDLVGVAEQHDLKGIENLLK
jgi:hypothetical protein